MRSLIIILLFPFIVSAHGLKTCSLDTVLMGSAFTFTAVHSDYLTAQNAVEEGLKEVIRIENLISSWKSESQTYNINSNAGVKPVKVAKELYDLIERSIKISKISNGYFDISFASIDKVWTFDGTEQEMPSEAVLKNSISKINYLNIVLNPIDTTVFLKEDGMKIGFGAIGKGYAADRAKYIMKQHNIFNGVVNAGGDVLVWGTNSHHEDWNIGIINPIQKGEIMSSIEVKDNALVTSGDYEKFVLINGERYGHIINPKTGLPAKGVLSVSVIAETAELADAMATAVFVLGTKDGLDLINHLKGVECIIVNAENKSLYSTGISINKLINE